MSKIIFNKFFIFFIVLLILGSSLFYLLKRGEKVIQIENEKVGQNNNQEEVIPEESLSQLNKSSISAIRCENYNRRPIAVVLAEDSVARPLSGISQADLIIELPVITGSITRMIAIFQCQDPIEIGSLRSARHDFIPLAMGLDAILVNWGGSRFALDLLDQKVMDNIDALTNPYQSFWRKESIPPPHNGFSSMENLLRAAKAINYRLVTNFEGYPHLESSKLKTQNSKEKYVLEIGYSYPYNVKYEYNSETNSYLRWRGGRPEIDRLTGRQIETKNIAIMVAFSRQLDKEYNDMDIEGEGRAVVYRDGEEIEGSWRKDKSNLSSKLYFFDEKGEEIKFTSGSIWVEIVEPYQQVNWK